MTYLVIRHKVKDYDTWKVHFDAHGAARAAAGSTGGHLLRGLDDPNEVVIFFKWDELEKARQFVQSPDLREVMEKAGVTDKPDVYFLDAVENLSA